MLVSLQTGLCCCVCIIHQQSSCQGVVNSCQCFPWTWLLTDIFTYFWRTTWLRNLQFLNLLLKTCISCPLNILAQHNTGISYLNGQFMNKFATQFTALVIQKASLIQSRTKHLNPWLHFLARWYLLHAWYHNSDWN